MTPTVKMKGRKIHPKFLIKGPMGYQRKYTASFFTEVFFFRLMLRSLSIVSGGSFSSESDGATWIVGVVSSWRDAEKFLFTSIDPCPDISIEIEKSTDVMPIMGNLGKRN